MNFLEKQDDLLVELDKAQRTDKDFEHVYKDFESQKVCYLPLSTFLLKPGQRLLHYKLILESKCSRYILHDLMNKRTNQGHGVSPGVVCLYLVILHKMATGI